MKTKMNIFIRFYYAVFMPHKYKELCKTSGGAAFAFVLFLLLITGLAQLSSTAGGLKRSMKEELGVDNVKEMVENYIPAFALSDGKLKMEDTIAIGEGAVLIYFDTDIEKIELRDVEYLANDGFEILILGSATNLVAYNKQDGKYQNLIYSQIFENNNTYTRDNLIRIIDVYLKIILVIGIVFYYVFLLARYFFQAFVVALAGFILFAILQKKLPFEKVMIASIYGGTLGAVISSLAVVMTDSFEIRSSVIWGLRVCYVIVGGFSITALTRESTGGLHAPSNQDVYYPNRPYNDNNYGADPNSQYGQTQDDYKYEDPYKPLDD